jgi:hypothetical protein
VRIDDDARLPPSSWSSPPPSLDVTVTFSVELLLPASLLSDAPAPSG